MKDFHGINLLRVVAVLAAAAGLLLAVRGTLRVRECSTRMKEYAKLASALDDRKARLARADVAIEVYRAMPVQEAVPLGTIASNCLAGQEFTIRDTGSEPVEAGWTVRRAELASSDTDLASVAGLMAAAESNRPPWRVTECVIEHRGGSPGSAQVRIMFETIEHRTSGSLFKLIENHARGRGTDNPLPQVAAGSLVPAASPAASN